jgi:hypothetical protein
LEPPPGDICNILLDMGGVPKTSPYRVYHTFVRMSALVSPTSSFSATVMGFLARRRKGEDENDMLNHLVASPHLQDMLTNLGDELVTVHNDVMRTYKEELASLLGACETAAGVHFRAPTSPRTVEATDPLDPADNAETRELRAQITRIDQEISALASRSSRRGSISPDISRVSVTTALDDTITHLQPTDFADGVAHFIKGVTSLLQREFLLLQDELAKSKPSRPVAATI